MKANRKKSRIQKGAHAVSKGEETKKRLLLGALELFAQDGFMKVSIQDIADRCKMSHSALFFHFRSKEELVEAALELIARDNHRIVDGKKNLEDNAYTLLMKHFLGNLEWAIQLPSQAQIHILLWYFSTFSPRFETLYQKDLELGRKRVLAIVLAGMREGLFHPSGDPVDVAELLHEALMGEIINFITQSKKASTNRTKVAKKWQLLFKGLLNFGIEDG